MKRKGMMLGKGKRGYHNIIPKDPKVHSDSGRGIKQPQKIPSIFRGEENLGKIDDSFNQNDLRQFSGTENYYAWSILFPRFKLTDGTKYLSEKAQAYWLMDVIGSYQCNQKFRNEGFQVWKLKKTKDDEAIVVAEDGNGNKLATQKIPYTDFFEKYKGDEITLYFTNEVIILPSEY